MTLLKKLRTAAFAASAVALVAALSLTTTNALAAPATGSCAPVASEAEPEAVPNETLLTFEDDALAQQVLAAAERSDALTAKVVADDLAGQTIISITCDTPAKAEALIGAAEALPGVSAQPNYVYKLVDGESEALDANDPADALALEPFALPTNFPNDYFASLQYYLLDIGNGSSNSGSNILEAWDLVRSQPSHGKVTVAVIDSGIRADHEDLQEHVDLDLAYNTFTGENDAPDEIGHGTAVTGVIAATANNELGVTGVASAIDDLVTVVPLKIFEDSGETDTSVIAEALDHLDGLVEDGTLSDLKVVNMSVGIYYKDGRPSDSALLNVIDHLVQEHGVLVVASGGNGDENQNALTIPIYPSDDELCLSVTALTETGANAEFSDYNLDKDIAAPGVNIATTSFEGSGAYCYEAGTSFSAPITSGVAALMFAVDPTLTPAEAIEIIKATAAPIPDTSVNNWGDKTGCAGALDAGAALREVIERAGGDVSAEGVATYRLYNSYTGEHLFTNDRNEYDTLGSLGWSREGVAWHSPEGPGSGADAMDATENALVAVYRLYNPFNGDHLYTTDEAEYDALCETGWQGEDVKMWGVGDDAGLTIYRLYNPWQTENGGAYAHLWTADEHEYASLAEKDWVQEGPAWRALS